MCSDITTLQHYFSETQKSFTPMDTLDIRLLIQHSLQISAEEFMLSNNRILSEKEKQDIDQLIKRRTQGEPVSKIIGRKDFWSYAFTTSPDVLDPRPDSEVLIETILELKPGQNTTLSFLDMGTGSGCLIITLLKLYTHSQGAAIDISESALDVAQKNAQKHDVLERLKFYRGSWWGALKEAQHFDIIVTNPPYIRSDDIADLDVEVREFDPLTALDGGADGLNPYREIIEKADQYLNEGGVLVLEIGFDQASDIENLIKDNPNLSFIACKTDLAERPRCVIAQKK